MKKNKISVWLMRKYLGWQQSMGELKSQAEFAKYLGFNPSTLSMWMTGKQDPDLHSADLLAHKLGPEVYDVLNLPHPPEFIQKLEAVYDELTPEQRQSLSDKINKILSDL
jgi:transcriptional regulator with XRE-family HTH domain